MTDRRARKLSLAAALVAAAVAGTAVQAQTPAPPAQPAARAPAAEPEKVPIGYIEIRNDQRYIDRGAYTGIRLRTIGRPFVGAEVAIEESATTSRVIRKNFVLEHAEVADANELIATIERWRREQNIQLVLLDADANAIDQAARKTRASGVTLFNVSAPEDRLRGKDCAANVLHTMPSTSMYMDALMQYLVFKKWRNILALVGPLPEDAETMAAFERSVKRFGARLVDKKSFVPGNDPRQRELNNVALMTSSATDYDIVFVADYDGDFARMVPYETNRARPVVGATGLTPATWHWAFERYGSTQVQSRFLAKAGRQMLSTDWAAWAAVKAIVNAAVRSRTAEGDKLAAFIRTDTFRFDASMGAPLSFRPWNNQLRTPILLATADAVLEIAPIEGFLHQFNELDTLGEDRPDTTCKF